MANIAENQKENNSINYYEINNWEDENLDLKNNLLRGIYAFGFENPSSVQKKAIYPMINNYYKGRRRDIIVKLNLEQEKQELLL